MNKKLQSTLLVLLGSMLLASCGGGGNKDTGPKYTYHTYLSTNPKTWNTHNWETSDEGYITSFTEMGFYDVALNANKNGYEVVTEMAAAFPKDVTAEARNDEGFENYGYTGNIRNNLIWDIELNPSAVWEDGKAITADDYVKSMQLQLDPKYVNYRADSYFGSNFVIANAEKYYKQGRYTLESVYDYKDYINKSSGGWIEGSPIGGDGNLYINLGVYTSYVSQIFSNADSDTTFYSVIDQFSGDSDNYTVEVRLAGQRIIDAVAYYTWQYIDHTGNKDWDDVKKLNDVKSSMMTEYIELYEFDDNEVFVRKNVDQSLNLEDETTYIVYSRNMLINDLKTFVYAIGNGRGDAGNTVFNYMLPLFANKYNDEECDFGEVGIKKVNDYKIRLYLKQEISKLDLEFALSSNWLVRTDLYERLTSTFGDLTTTKYATGSVNNYMSYGPYKLVTFTDGKAINMVKNDKWYGWTDGKHEGQFATTGITTVIVQDHETVRKKFEQGELDDFTMDRTDMAIYGNSRYKTTVPESYTQKISFNSSRERLKGNEGSNAKVNKTVLANENFRKGLSLGFDRNDFAASTTAGSQAFTGLLNDLYLTNVTTGEKYRDTAQGKGVYEAVYGKLGGNPYSDSYTESALEERVNGYNHYQAVYHVAKGLKEELERTDDTKLESGQSIDLEIRVYDATSEITIAMKNFLEKSMKTVVDEAVKELKKEPQYSNLELGFTLTSTTDEDYYNTAKKGNYDLIFSIWGGAATQPYNLMQVYCDATFTNCCEFGFKGKQDKVNIEIDDDGDGTKTSKSFNTWWTEVTSLVEPDIQTLQENVENYAPGSDNADELEYESALQELADGQARYNEIHNKKLNILAGLEAGILNRFEAIPLVARGTSSLRSARIVNGSDTYINLVGFGGLRSLTYLMNDTEWSNFVRSSEYSTDIYK